MVKGSLSYIFCSLSLPLCFSPFVFLFLDDIFPPTFLPFSGFPSASLHLSPYYASRFSYSSASVLFQLFFTPFSVSLAYVLTCSLHRAFPVVLLPPHPSSRSLVCSSSFTSSFLNSRTQIADILPSSSASLGLVVFIFTFFLISLNFLGFLFSSRAAG